ncbi:hypothetical protein MPSEU_000196500 [Mayamaea pseudoterrestris]|nr:hypothetical protein MPSEU_000196500 [Mayamaea pseudoterrestris]
MRNFRVCRARHSSTVAALHCIACSPLTLTLLHHLAILKSTNMDESIDGFLHLVAGAVPFRKRLKIWFLISDYMNCIIDEGPAQQEIVRLFGTDECETLVADTLRRLSLTRLIMDGAREPLVDDILESLVSFADKCNKANFISVHEAIQNASEYAHRVVPEIEIASAPLGLVHRNLG